MSVIVSADHVAGFSTEIWPLKMFCYLLVYISGMRSVLLLLSADVC